MLTQHVDLHLSSRFLFAQESKRIFRTLYFRTGHLFQYVAGFQLLEILVVCLQDEHAFIRSEIAAQIRI